MNYQTDDTIIIKYVEYTILEAIETQRPNTRKMIWGTLYLKCGERGTKLYEAPIMHDGLINAKRIRRTACTIEQFQNRNN